MAAHPLAPATGALDPGVLVRLDSVDLRVGRRDILVRIDLVIRRGEILTLVGPNGAGKTTLVKLALGLLRPSRGTIRRRPGLSIGYVPQRLVPDPVLPLTVRRLLSLTAPCSRAQAIGALEKVGTPQLLDQSLDGLSGGEMQRILLARALLRAPDLLVLDEPMQNVDVAGQIDLYRLINRIRDEQGCAVLMVSHDLHVVMASTDQVLCLNRHICCSGKPDDVRNHPAFRSLFGAAGAEALALYSHDHHHRHDLHGDVVGSQEKARFSRESGESHPAHGSGDGDQGAWPVGRKLGS